MTNWWGGPCAGFLQVLERKASSLSAPVELEPTQRSLDQLVSREAVPPSVLLVYPRHLGAC